MVKTRSRSNYNFIVLKNESLLLHERSISRPSLKDQNVDSIIASSKGIFAENDFDELISGLLGEFTLCG